MSSKWYFIEKTKIMNNKKSTIMAVVLGVCAGIMGYVLGRKKKKGIQGFSGKKDSLQHTFTACGQGIYERHIKRLFDIFCSIMAFTCFSWLYLTIAIFVKIKLGTPVLFTQPRPGKDEKIFKLYKFRTMTDERDENGELLEDEARLTEFGKWLRSTSLDELPEAFNILKGDMSVIGPRPQLVRDMVFMTKTQRRRHSVRPGLSGLAQVNGRNDIDWEEKLDWDLKYIKHITFLGDMKIIFQTVLKAFVKREGITEDDMATAEDFGDYLLSRDKIDRENYERKQKYAKKLIANME